MKLHCPKHPKKTAEHGRVKITFTSTATVCKDGDGKEIRCPLKKCNEPMVLEEEEGDYSNVQIGKFSSMTGDQKRAHIKKRAKDFNKLEVNRANRRYQATSHLTKHG